MDKNLEKKLLNDIKESGFQTELEIASILKKKGWKVEPNTNYTDFESGKGREIDIIAYKNPSNKKKYYLEMHLVIEVKKSKRPWIIFTSEINNNLYRNHASDLLLRLRNKKRGFDYSRIARNSPNYEFDKLGTSFKEAFKKPNEPSKIYEAILSACKAAHYRTVDAFPDKKLGDEKYDPQYTTEIYISHPIVVLEGELYEAFLEENGEMAIRESNFIPIQFHHQSKNIEEETYYCDIVTKKGLLDYELKLENWITEILDK